MSCKRSLWNSCVGEVIGTYILVFFGVGSVHTAVLASPQTGLWQVAAVWGVAVSLAIYATSAVSGAHMNPAMTIAFAAYRKFPRRNVVPYILAQLVGAILAAATLYCLFCGALNHFELVKGLTRGAPGSELSGMVYGEYFPNPGMFGDAGSASGIVSLAQAMLAEGLGTALLAFFVFAVTDNKNSGGPGGKLAPLFIGLTVSIIISIIAPLTQAGLNPARDFGPRLFAYFAGWGSIAIPGARGGFFSVYILAPILGALAGAAIYERVVKPAFAAARSEMAAETTPAVSVGDAVFLETDRPDSVRA